MKKMFAKLRMPSLLAVAFLLSGLFLGAASAQAQSAAIPIKPSTSTGWKSTTDATSVLNVEVSTISDQLTSGSGNPAQLKAKSVIYAGILADLNNGIAVPEAAYNNYYRTAAVPGTSQVTKQAIPGLTAGDWQNIYTEMVQLLSL